MHLNNTENCEVCGMEVNIGVDINGATIVDMRHDEANAKFAFFAPREMCDDQIRSALNDINMLPVESAPDTRIRHFIGTIQERLNGILVAYDIPQQCTDGANIPTEWYEFDFEAQPRYYPTGSFAARAVQYKQ